MNNIILFIFILFLINLFLFCFILFKINGIKEYFKECNNAIQRMLIHIEYLRHVNDTYYTYCKKVFSCIYREDNEGNGMILYE